MSQTATPSQTVGCPGHEFGCCAQPQGHEQVEVLTSARAKTVRLAPCSALLAQGWRGHQLAFAKGDADWASRLGL